MAAIKSALGNKKGPQLTQKNVLHTRSPRKSLLKVSPFSMVCEKSMNT